MKIEVGKLKPGYKRVNVSQVKRRPSFEIANDFMELNFKPIIEAETEATLSRGELRRRRRQQKRQARRGRHSILRNSAVIAAIFIVIAVATVFVWWCSSSEPVNAADKSVRQFVIDKGATTEEVANALQKAGFIRNTLAFRIYKRLHGGDIQAGTHMLSPSYGMTKIVDKLATADSDEVDIQIPPGLTLNELKEVFKGYDYTDAEIEKALSAHYDSPILADKPDNAGLEGYLYPDTYRVLAGDGLDKVIKKALNQLALVSSRNNLKVKFAGRGLSFYQGITLASIVTKEVKNQADQKLVASVFYNRLEAGMNLGSDVTFQYAYKMGMCNTNSPDCTSTYNTRNNPGLPPGPIANPSLSAMLAVAEPPASGYYYFVAGEDGKTYFSETADQHNQAVADHCGKLCK